MKISICAADAIDRVELLKNNVLEEMIVHSGSWENKKFADDEVIRVKFTVEFGWGPNPRFYKDMLVKSISILLLLTPYTCLAFMPAQIAALEASSASTHIVPWSHAAGTLWLSPDAIHPT